MDVLALDRVMIAARDLESTVERYEALLGVRFADPVDSRVETPAGVQRSRVAHGAPGLEIVAPAAADAALVDFLDERGPGLFGVVLRVADLDAAAAELADAGVDPIAVESPADADERHYHPDDFAGVYLVLTEYDHPAF